MKGIIKLFPVALAVLALASCSNDDFFGSNPAAKKGTLQVNVESMGDGITRSAYTAANARIWQADDEFAVYDDQLHRYDYYKFDATSKNFLINGQQDLDEPQFVAFPSNAVSTTYWNKSKRQTAIDMGIPSTWNFGETDDNGTAAYLSQLPMWGTVTEFSEAGLKANAYFLTSYIKVTIDNALNNVKAVRITAYSDIAGTVNKNIAGIANAVLSENDVPLSETTLATPTKGDATYPIGNQITVNLESTTEKFVKTGTSCIFFPLIAGHYGKLVVEYQDASNTWQNLKTWTDKTFERGGLPYGASLKTLSASGKDIPQLNAAIATKVSETGDIDITVADAATGVSSTTAGTSDEKNTIVLPAMACDKLTLTVPSFTGVATTDELWLTGDEFTKTIVLSPAAFSNIAKLHVNLPNANVVLGGAGSYTTAPITIEAAKTITYGDGETTNATFGNQNLGVEVSSITVADKATIGTLQTIAECGNIEVKKGGTAGNITLAANHRANSVKIAGTSGDITVPASVLSAAATTAIEVSGTAGAITATSEDDAATNVVVSGTAGAITINGAKNIGTVEVSGAAGAIDVKGTGAVTVSGNAASITNTTGDVEISGAPAYNATNYAKISGNVTTSGNVTVSLTGEGAAVAGTVTIKDAKTLTLNQGYIKTLEVNAGAKKIVTITNGTNAAYASIGALTLTAGNISISNASKWNGKKIGEGIPAPGTGDTYVKATVATAYEAYASQTFIATATAFAQSISDVTKIASTATVVNDIDLNDEDFAPAKAITGMLRGVTVYKTGGIPTISNLTLPELAKNTTTGYGFIINAAGSDATVKDLKFNGVTITTKNDGTGCANIGALAGVVNGKLTVSNVTLEGVDIKAKKLSYNIGGLIGSVAAAGETVLTDVTVTSPKIEGYKILGGLIGFINNGGKATLVKGGTTSAPTYCVATDAVFTQATNSTFTDSDPHLSMVGSLIGSTDNLKANAANVVIAVASATAPTYTVSNESTIAPLRKWSIADGVGTKMVDIVKLPIMGLTGANTLVKLDLETGDKYNVQIAIGTTAAAAFKNAGTLTKSSDAGNLVDKKLLNYFKNF